MKKVYFLRNPDGSRDKITRLQYLSYATQRGYTTSGSGAVRIVHHVPSTIRGQRLTYGGNSRLHKATGWSGS